MKVNKKIIAVRIENRKNNPELDRFLEILDTLTVGSKKLSYADEKWLRAFNQERLEGVNSYYFIRIMTICRAHDVLGSLFLPVALREICEKVYLDRFPSDQYLFKGYNNKERFLKDTLFCISRVAVAGLGEDHPDNAATYLNKERFLKDTLFCISRVAVAGLREDHPDNAATYLNYLEFIYKADKTMNLHGINRQYIHADDKTFLGKYLLEKSPVNRIARGLLLYLVDESEIEINTLSLENLRVYIPEASLRSAFRKQDLDDSVLKLENPIKSYDTEKLKLEEALGGSVDESSVLFIKRSYDRLCWFVERVEDSKHKLKGEMLHYLYITARNIPFGKEFKGLFKDRLAELFVKPELWEDVKVDGKVAKAFLSCLRGERGNGFLLKRVPLDMNDQEIVEMLVNMYTTNLFDIRRYLGGLFDKAAEGQSEADTIEQLQLLIEKLIDRLGQIEAENARNLLGKILLKLVYDKNNLPDELNKHTELIKKVGISRSSKTRLVTIVNGLSESGVGEQRLAAPVMGQEAKRYKRKVDKIKDVTGFPARVIEEGMKQLTETGKTSVLIPLTPGEIKNSAPYKSFKEKPVPGYGIKSVEAIVNRNSIARFRSTTSLLEQRHGKPAFERKWDEMSNPSLRGNVAATIKDVAHVKNGNVTLFPALWHGTSRAAIESIGDTGMASLQTRDKGWFGDGSYGTDGPEYAFKIYAASDEGCLLYCSFQYYLALPVIGTDESELKGKGAVANNDLHYVPIRESKRDIGHPCNNESDLAGSTRVEVVVFDPGQALPLYAVELEALPKVGLFQKMWKITGIK